MVIGVCQVELVVSDAASIKDKRRVVRSVVQRLRSKFNVAVAEVGELDSWHVATLGIVCVSNETGHATSMLSRVLDWLESERMDAEIGAVATRVEVW